jgi:hypothetical protein
MNEVQNEGRQPCLKNKAIRRTIEELIYDMNGAKIFSKLDAIE